MQQSLRGARLEPLVRLVASLPELTEFGRPELFILFELKFNYIFTDEQNEMMEFEVLAVGLLDVVIRAIARQAQQLVKTRLLFHHLAQIILFRLKI